jgi:hypothetical protein
MTRDVTNWSPGDIIAEKIGGREVARYIIIEKGISIDYRDVEYSTYKGYIIHVCESWEGVHTVGNTWLVDEQQIKQGAIIFERVFESGLSWEGCNVRNEF